jgi:tryptophan synthase beta chain
VLADAEGQILEAHSVSAGLDYPGVGPQHAQLRDSGRARYESVTDDEALAAFHEFSRLEGILPALEPAHAIAWLMADADREPASEGAGFDVLCLSGRGDKDLAEVLERSHG